MATCIEGQVDLRERRLWIAFDRYMRGKIKKEELERLEQQDASDFKEALLKLAGLVKQNGHVALLEQTTNLTSEVR